MENNELARVLQISQRMAETRTLAPLLEYTIDEAIDLAGAQRGYLVLVKHDGSLDFRVSRDNTHSPITDPADQISISILGKVIQSGQPQLFRDAIHDPRLKRSASVVALKLRSVMGVPLISRGVILGAIYVENRKASGIFKDDDLAPLAIFANQAAVAIENAILNEELETRMVIKTAELRKALDQLEERWQAERAENELRTIMLGTIAHDVRVPLALACTAMALLEDTTFGALTGEQREWARKARDATRFALDMLEDVFDLAKLDLGVLELDKDSTPLVDFLKEIYEIAQAFNWPEGVEFVAQVPSALPAIAIDKGRIRRVIFNLLSNSLKFITSGSVTLYAESQPEQRRVLVGVRDTGEGISEEDQRRIFKRFEQADPNVVRRKKGVGLGLAICREFVEMHDGQIWVESAPGQGADFKFTLPVGDG